MVVAETSNSVCLFAFLLLQWPMERNFCNERYYAWDLLDVLVGGDVGAGDLLHHLLSHSPQGKTTVPGPRHQELVVQPGLVKDPVVVGILTNTDWVKGG